MKRKPDPKGIKTKTIQAIIDLNENVFYENKNNALIEKAFGEYFLLYGNSFYSGLPVLKQRMLLDELNDRPRSIKL